MPRKDSIPEQEVAICARLRTFREGTQIPRTVFVAAAGIVGKRLENSEFYVTPVHYGLFIAIHRRFLLSPRWLVTGEGEPTLTIPIEEGQLGRTIPDREWLSETYERTLRPYLESRADEALAFWTGPGGFTERAAALAKELTDPACRAKYSTDFLHTMERELFNLASGASLALGDKSRLETLVRKLKAQRRKS